MVNPGVKKAGSKSPPFKTIQKYPVSLIFDKIELKKGTRV
jgi:hypothetical protein